MTLAGNCGRGLALVRIAVGLYFLNAAWNKLSQGWLGSGEPLTRSLQRNMEQSESFYLPFLEDVVLPNADLFAKLVALGELGVALSLILGALVPLGVTVGIVMLVNYILMKGLANLREGTDWLFFVSFLGLLLGMAGLTWGVDGLLFRTRRRVERPVVVSRPRGQGRVTTSPGH